MKPMQHSEIERDSLIDRYVRNTLVGAERQSFEEHFLDCTQCLEQLEIASSLRQAIRESAVEAVAAPPVVRPRRWYLLGWVQAAAAACLVVAMATSIGFFEQMQHARRELASAQTELASARGLASSPAVYVLGQSRGGSESNQIALPRASRWMVFSIEMDTTQFPSYHAILSDFSGKEIWQQAGIQPASPDAIGVTVPSNLLAPGSYSLIIQPSGQAGAQSTLSRFSLRFH
jgi:hypothetical protein